MKTVKKVLEAALAELKALAPKRAADTIMEIESLLDVGIPISVLHKHEPNEGSAIVRAYLSEAKATEETFRLYAEEGNSFDRLSIDQVVLVLK